MQMAGLPTKPPLFDGKDPTGTVRKICDYLNQMQEQLDFQLGQIQKLLESLNNGKQ
jgi:hypothetical protein